MLVLVLALVLEAVPFSFTSVVVYGLKLLLVAKLERTNVLLALPEAVVLMGVAAAL